MSLIIFSENEVKEKQYYYWSTRISCSSNMHSRFARVMNETYPWRKNLDYHMPAFTLVSFCISVINEIVISS